VTIGVGCPTQVPEETVRVLPTDRIPETNGEAVTSGADVTACVDLVNLTVEPAAFVAVTLASRNLPTFEFVSPIEELEPVTSLQPLAKVPDSLATLVGHSNH
jgi:hypothetical protein